jgi:hypothetical protein
MALLKSCITSTYVVSKTHSARNAHLRNSTTTAGPKWGYRSGQVGARKLSWVLTQFSLCSQM